MNLSKVNLSLCFLSSFILSFLTPSIAPYIKIMFFAPFLVITFYQKELISSLWWAFATGLIIDLISFQPPFGFYACNYVITTLILHPQRRNFFADHMTTLPIMTFFFSVVSTILQLIVLQIFANPVMISMRFLLTDVLIMPLVDALFAYVWFELIPVAFFKKSKRRSTF